MPIETRFPKFTHLHMTKILHHPPNRRRLGVLLAGLIALNGAIAAEKLEVNQELGLKHPAGFVITRFATREMAPDATALTFDSQGRVVVSGRGWIKRLEDTDDDGVADKAVEFAEPATGARGMVFIGNDLYCLSDGWLGRYLDSDGDGLADGTPQRFFKFAFGPEGVFTMRRGPDGAWYVLAGQQAGLGPAHWNFPGSPIRNPVGGALLHISPDLSRSEVVADGFLHAADFDFHQNGPIFTYDQGYARDNFLPWMTFPRLFQVAHGADHGWHTEPGKEPRALPDYDPAQVPVLWSANAGEPSGMTFYRHHQFPTDYRDGLFTADWENGRIWFFKLQPFQSGFTAAPSPFIEPVGHNGFTPTAMAVAKDGSLYIATGGRGTGSGIYRVKYTKIDPKTGKLPDQPPPYLSNFDAVLRAPQRLESWSRAEWMPLAMREGRRSFQQVAMSIGDPEEYKLVAIDVMTELFGGLTRWEANITAKAPFPSVRARTAWSIARYQFEGSLPVLQELLRDESPLVLRAALEVYVDQSAQLPPLELYRVASQFLDHVDPRVHEEAMALAAKLPEAQWQQLVKQSSKKSPLYNLMLARARLKRHPVTNEPNADSLSRAISVLRQPEKGTPELGLQALKVVRDSFGGFRYDAPTAGAFASYELKISPTNRPDMTAAVLQATRPLFPTGNPIVDAELARTLALFEDNDPATPLRMLGAFGSQTPVTSDIHYLDCIARLNPSGPVPALTNLAEVFLWLDNKIGPSGKLPGLNWRPRAIEIATQLIKRHPDIGAALVSNAKFPDPAHAWLAGALDPKLRDKARERFFEFSAQTNRFVWNADVIKLLAESPSDELFNRLRAQWNHPELHDAIVQALAQDPHARDREWFVAALVSVDPGTTAGALRALTKLDDPKPDETLAPVIQVLHRAIARPGQVETRKAAIKWLNKRGGWTGTISESARDRRSLDLIYQPVFDWFARAHTPEAAKIAGMTEDEFKYWETQITEAPWTLGKANRGEVIFKEHRCAECHAGGSGYGPGLAGLARTYAPAGLMRKVVYPHLDVAPGEGVVELVLRSGERLSGIVVFESLDNIILRQEDGVTVRISQSEIARRRVTNDSIMPVGLLKDVNARSLADLYAYLETLD